MNVRELINSGANELTKLSESPRLDASLILAFTLGMTRARLLASYPDIVPEGDILKYKELLHRRASGEPVAYILGEKEFFGNTFFVEDGVLVPRADTEILVETTISLIKKYNLKSCIDMCTGTGCISISIQKELPNLKVYASDISPIAQRVFNINNKKLTDGKIEFIRSNLFNNFQDRKFDIIATNPPYLTRQETEDRVNDRWKEPELALDGGEDGLDLIRIIIDKAKSYLNPGGWLLIEAGPNQMTEMKKEMQKNSFKSINILQDIENRDRIIVGQYE